jgi:hypothetical protein
MQTTEKILVFSPGEKLIESQELFILRKKKGLMEKIKMESEIMDWGSS